MSTHFSFVMHFVYALYSPDHDKIYIGESENLITRMTFHNHLAGNGQYLNIGVPQRDHIVTLRGLEGPKTCGRSLLYHRIIQTKR